MRTFEPMMRRHAVVVGASYAGLVAAAALRCNDWDVTVLERSSNRLRTGGGVVVQRRMAEYLGQHGISFPRVPSVPARTRQFFRTDGTVLRMPESAAVYTAWDVLLREVELLVGDERIRRGVSVRRFSGLRERAWVELDDGTRIDADLVVAADGIGSLARRALLPGVEPVWSGYVAWRGMVDESIVDSATRTVLGDSLNSYTGAGMTIVAYLVPSVDGETEPGRRRYNWVWYQNIEDREHLSRILTDRDGAVHRASVGRGLLTDAVVREARSLAERHLHPAFAEIVLAAEEPFLQSIEDLNSPRLVFGRTVLIGDAASLVRPHIGSGTAKAVDDAITLAHALTEPKEDGSCLAAWEQARLDDHYGLAEYGRAVAWRLGLGVTTPESSTSSTAVLR
jgi:2,6-dihydroxypyridine 3-monooxygenase